MPGPASQPRVRSGGAASTSGRERLPSGFCVIARRRFEEVADRAFLGNIAALHHDDIAGQRAHRSRHSHNPDVENQLRESVKHTLQREFGGMTFREQDRCNAALRRKTAEKLGIYSKTRDFLRRSVRTMDNCGGCRRSVTYDAPAGFSRKFFVRKQVHSLGGAL